MKKNNKRAVEMKKKLSLKQKRAFILGMGLVLYGSIALIIMATTTNPINMNFQNILGFVGGIGLIIIGWLLFIWKEEEDEYNRILKKLKNIWDSFRVIQ